MSIGNQQARIKAFNDTRDRYTQNDGGLNQWIMSMQTPEHSDLFQSNGLLRPAAANAGNTPNRPSPNRPLGSISGSKLMQEDGKKLMAAANKYGGKAGVAAKGLFAKGKDKFRSASGGNKVAH